jgi:tRNA A37 threonylcarbamoyltransferase TsaD
MAKRSALQKIEDHEKPALQKIEDHEKLCRIMQKQTFEQIKEVKERITRIERMIIAGGGAIVLALLLNMIK